MRIVFFDVIYPRSIPKLSGFMTNTGCPGVCRDMEIYVGFYSSSCVCIA